MSENSLEKQYRNTELITRVYGLLSSSSVVVVIVDVFVIVAVDTRTRSIDKGDEIQSRGRVNLMSW